MQKTAVSCTSKTNVIKHSVVQPDIMMRMHLQTLYSTDLISNVRGIEKAWSPNFFPSILAITLTQKGKLKLSGRFAPLLRWIIVSHWWASYDFVICFIILWTNFNEHVTYASEYHSGVVEWNTSTHYPSSQVNQTSRALSARNTLGPPLFCLWMDGQNLSD